MSHTTDILLSSTISNCAPTIMSQKTDPSKFLSSIIGLSVVVKLHNGVQYLGNLQSIDGFMNVALDSAKEVVGEKEGRSFNDVFIRGNNGMFIENFRIKEDTNIKFCTLASFR